MATTAGTVKKTPLKEFENQRANGKIAIDLREDDTLVGVAVTDGQQNVLLFSSTGKAVCFNEADVRSMGRTASGVRGIRLQEGQKVISLIIATEGTVLNITENGYGKRTKLEEFTCHKRGGQGLIAIQTSARNGAVVGAVLVNDNDEIMLITDGGTLVRTPVDGISVVGRNTQGVTIIKLGKNEKVIGVDRIEGLAGVDGADEDDLLEGAESELGASEETTNDDSEPGEES
jgi:DNA gyrase subunit A